MTPSVLPASPVFEPILSALAMATPSFSRVSFFLAGSFMLFAHLFAALRFCARGWHISRVSTEARGRRTHAHPRSLRCSSIRGKTSYTNTSHAGGATDEVQRHTQHCSDGIKAIGRRRCGEVFCDIVDLVYVGYNCILEEPVRDRDLGGLHKESVFHWLLLLTR